MSDVLLEATSLSKAYPGRRDLLGRATDLHHAVRDVSLTVRRGETVAVVGESGAGKSTLGRLVLRLIEPDAGTIMLDGVDLRSLSPRALRSTRARMQMIFQDPFSSLDPRLPVEAAVAESLTCHFRLRASDLRTRVLEQLDRVGISERQAGRYPYEFSGGQLQRIAIARALAVEPDLMVCDEPVAALDVSIQAQVINLLDDLQRERGVAYVFISHNLALVRLIADRVAVMYRGRVVEDGPASAIFTTPRHPYTKALLDVIPVPNPRRRVQREAAKRLNVNSAERASAGCSYAARCPLATQHCWTVEPELEPLVDSTRVSCHVVHQNVAQQSVVPRERVTGIEPAW